MDTNTFLNQWAKRPIPNDAGAWKDCVQALNQVIEVEKRKQRIIRRHGRGRDRSACVQVDLWPDRGLGF